MDGSRSRDLFHNRGRDGQLRFIDHIERGYCQGKCTDSSNCKHHGSGQWRELYGARQHCYYRDSGGEGDRSHDKQRGLLSRDNATFDGNKVPLYVHLDQCCGRVLFPDRKGDRQPWFDHIVLGCCCDSSSTDGTDSKHNLTNKWGEVPGTGDHRDHRGCVGDCERSDDQERLVLPRCESPRNGLRKSLHVFVELGRSRVLFDYCGRY